MSYDDKPLSSTSRADSLSQLVGSGMRGDSCWLARLRFGGAAGKVSPATVAGVLIDTLRYNIILCFFCGQASLLNAAEPAAAFPRVEMSGMESEEAAKMCLLGIVRSDIVIDGRSSILLRSSFDTFAQYLRLASACDRHAT
jgi:hypothetical protein